MRHKFGFGISTRNRKELVLQCLEAVWNYADKDDVLVVCDDASTDGTYLAMKEWVSSHSHHFRCPVNLLLNQFQAGVAGTKFRIVEQLLQQRPDEIILIEDDVMPLSTVWADAILSTALEHTQAHLLYLPTNWKYGITFSTTGKPNCYQIEWKQLCSGMIMYFRAQLLRQVGNFEKKFGLFGYEHNYLTAQCLVAQGLNPEIYPHCAVLETQNLVMAQDVIHTRPRMAYHEVAQHNKDMDKKMQIAYGNKPFYERLMEPLRARFHALPDPGAAHYREQFFSLAKVQG